MSWTIAHVLSAAGAAALLLIGVRTASDALIIRATERSRGIRGREMKHGFRAFLHGLTGSGATGSRPAALLRVFVSVDAGRLSFEDTVPLLSGINVGALIPFWIAVGALSVPLSEHAGFLLLSVSLPLRVGLHSRRSTAVDVLIGTGIALLALTLLPTLLPVTAAPWELSPAGGIAVLILCAALAWAVGASLGSQVLILLLFSHGWLSAEFAAIALLCANLGGMLAGATLGRRLGVTAECTSTLEIALNLTVTLTGLVILSISSLRSAVAETGLMGIGIYFTTAHLLAVGIFNVIPRKRLISAVRSVSHSASVAAEHTGKEPHSFPALKLLRFDLPDALESNMQLMRRAVATMADIAAEMLMVAVNAGQMPEELRGAHERCELLDAQLAQREREVSAAVRKAVESPCTPGQALRLQQQFQIASELRNIGTDIGKLLKVLDKSYRKQLQRHPTSDDELFDISSRVLDFLNYDSDFLSGRIDKQNADIAGSMERAIDKARNKVRKRSRKSIEKNPQADVRGELAFIQAVGYLERIGDRCLTISRTVTEIERG